MNGTDDYNLFGIPRLISVVGWIAIRGFDLLFYCMHMLVIFPLYPERLTYLYFLIKGYTLCIKKLEFLGNLTSYTK